LSNFENGILIPQSVNELPDIEDLLNNDFAKEIEQKIQLNHSQ